MIINKVALLLLLLSLVVPAQAQKNTLLPDSTLDAGTTRLIESIAGKSEESWILRELSDLVLVRLHEPRWFNDSIQVLDRLAFFQTFYGKTIHSLRFLRLDPFGATIQDTIPKPLTWIERSGNAVRTKTHEQKVRNYTLFVQGDKVDPYQFVDTEQLLRSQRYLEDARIYICMVPLDTNRVDVVVVTHDVWPIALDVDLPHLNTGEVEIWHRNLFGIGMDFEQGVYWGPFEDKKIGFSGAVGLDNIFQSFVRVDAHYLNRFERSSYGFSINRDLLIPSIKYGGRIAYTRNRIDVDDYYEGVLLGPSDDQYNRLRFSSADLWLARSFALSEHSSYPLSRRNIALSARIFSLKFHERPDDLTLDYYPLLNRNVYLGSLVYSKQRSHLTQLIYSYGRSENVPSGRSAELVFGYEEFEKADRFYLGSRLAGGRFIGKLGYAYGDIAYGLFFRDGKTQGTWKFSWNYFTPLIPVGKAQSRTFFSGNYTYGFRSSTYEYLTLNDREGIAGFRNDSLRGTQRLLTHWETNFFMPKKLYGFRFVFYTSANFGWINNNRKFILGGKPYSSISMGVRIRNDLLVFSTFQFSVSWFPAMPRGSRVDWFDFSRADKLSLPRFQPTAPEPLWLRYLDL